MKKCRICAGHVKLIMDFGRVPIANGFIEKVGDREFFYNLSLVYCPGCFMVQLGEAVESEKLFNENYPFISSGSQVMMEHFRKLAEEIAEYVKDKKDPFVVELGCNDGVMLKHLTQRRIRHLGVEPCHNIAELARKEGVRVVGKFFNKKLAEEIVKKYGQADLISASNTICHIEDLNSVFEGIRILLKDDGVFMFEDPYIYNIVNKSSFDQVYDEHVYYFSGLSIRNLAKLCGLNLVDMKHQNVHGGSMRYFLKKRGNKVSLRVKRHIDKEKELGLDKLSGYKEFEKKVDKICKDLKRLLLKLKKRGERVVGYGATSKSTTLLNYAGIDREIVDYISDTTVAKIGKYTPGTHILVKSDNVFRGDKVIYTLLLAWNHKKEIFEKEKKYRENGGKFILYFPKVVIE